MWQYFWHMLLFIEVVVLHYVFEVVSGAAQGCVADTALRSILKLVITG